MLVSIYFVDYQLSFVIIYLEYHTIKLVTEALAVHASTVGGLAIGHQNALTSKDN